MHNSSFKEVRSRLYTMTLIFCFFYRQLETELEQCTTELQSTQQVLRQKEDMEEQVKFANQELEDSQATVRQHEAELARLREVLRRTEKELDERVEHLELRYLSAEKERSKFNMDIY